MILTIYAAFCLFFIGLFVFEDLILDLITFAKRLGPRELSENEIEIMRAIPESRIAIIIANWQEAEVIGRMINGNLKKLDYKNYVFFIGVYPNDTETYSAAQNLEAAHPARVQVVVNSKPGPTSKGQMLNEIVQAVFEAEAGSAERFDVILMHDSEDILHSLSLKVINMEMRELDFLQIPVFSFDRPLKDFVGSTYIDEFAELHTKDMFVREYLGATLPSAGVGTALSRRFVLDLMKKNQNQFLRQESLTEDYLLGMQANKLNRFRSGFRCYFIKVKNKVEYIATREYFPNQFQASIRQKTRWVLGIVFQGSEWIPFTGSLSNRYFLYRDRRGPMNNLVAMMTTLLTVYCLTYFWIKGTLPDFMFQSWFQIGSLIATFGMILRLFHRMRAVYRVNSAKIAITVILRWPLANIINFLSSARALRDFLQHKVNRKPLRWSKTSHQLPAGFGDE